ncbi:hypothetical protein CNE_1c35670 [Cupriavidus necator N-1]|uniref:Periplasmic heavy metal sensor n=1 Tax=Cupriavidus necator (strain ATCC 43291 / DSM 13513 / CCUG 52238 / LMG 8453 / N-1) TaxID=1042878 RepID=G0F023_CUPNN|nr:hypothetical protein [Cupriavidus necator]AEI78859.1 hypothetical protein CNE_1c35670 [Cupriavidus necator N-1]MDX6012618.1 hypothetical protein [Cupriavidus necator]
MPFPPTRLRTAASLLALCTACLLATPASALQSGPPPTGAMPPPPSAPASAESLGLSAAQARLWQAARSDTREAEAHALELHARLLRETADETPDAPLRPRAQAMDRLHDALEQDRRAVRERWLALDDSLDPAQRRRLRAAPEAARWMGLPPAGAMMMPPPGGPQR